MCSGEGRPTLLKPVPNFKLIQVPIFYDKILDIPDFQNFWSTFSLRKLKDISQIHRICDHIIYF